MITSVAQCDECPFRGQTHNRIVMDRDGLIRAGALM